MQTLFLLLIHGSSIPSQISSVTNPFAQFARVPFKSVHTRVDSRRAAYLAIVIPLSQGNVIIDHATIIASAYLSNDLVCVCSFTRAYVGPSDNAATLSSQGTTDIRVAAAAAVIAGNEGWSNRPSKNTTSVYTHVHVSTGRDTHQETPVYRVSQV